MQLTELAKRRSPASKRGIPRDLQRLSGIEWRNPNYPDGTDGGREGRMDLLIEPSANRQTIQVKGANCSSTEPSRLGKNK